MQTTAIGTVTNSLPQNEVILLTLLISGRYISYTDLRNNFNKKPYIKRFSWTRLIYKKLFFRNGIYFREKDDYVDRIKYICIIDSI